MRLDEKKRQKVAFINIGLKKDGILSLFVKKRMANLLCYPDLEIGDDIEQKFNV